MTQPEVRLVPATPTPVLVYNRIDANRRKTRLLLMSFAVALVPFVSGSAGCIVPSILATHAQLRPVDAVSTPYLWRYGGVLLVSMATVALALVAATAFLISRYGSRVVLRGAHARSVDPGQERDLVQVVENLSIGAGLPLPRLYVIESAAPNAFATGRSPHDASLVVTRGLLELLDRRELEGVIAHELSHIGNHDIGLSTTLAALVGTLTLPLKLLSAPFRPDGLRSLLGVFGLVANLGLVALFGLLGNEIVFQVWQQLRSITGRDDRFMEWLTSVEPLLEPPWYFWWLQVHELIAPVYAVFGAPVAALLIRQAVSRQREFLADADAALLTRDPEGLALALVKIGAVGGERLRVGEGTVHLCFVDPLPQGSWLHVVFPSHPSLAKRVELLARMGNGIAQSAIQAASDAAARVRFTKPGPEEFHASLPNPPRDGTASSTQTTEPTGTGDDGFARFDDRPDTGSPVQAVAAAGHALTPLYERPDGWSRVLAQLPESAVVIPIATEGHFIRVTTAEHQAGYVSRSAPLAALRNFQP